MKPRERPARALIIGLLLGIFWLFPGRLRADAIGGELIILTIHVQTQRDAPVELYKRRLDERGQYVLTPGLELYYDKQLEEPWGYIEEIRFSGGLLSDSITHTFGYFAAMSRFVLYSGEKFENSLHVGPGLIYRESWRDVPGYNPDNPLEESDYFLKGYEYKWMILGEVDLLWRFSPDLQAVWSIVPGLPYVVVHSMGLRWSY